MASGAENMSEEEQEDLGRIDNPFEDLEDLQITEMANDFAERKGLWHLRELFARAGMVIRDPMLYEDVPGILDEEKRAIAEEHAKGFFAQPKQLRVNVMTLCVAAVVQGWNQTAANGANLGWPDALNITNSWAFAGINAAMYFSASLVGCWLSDPLNEVIFFKVFFGRRAAIGTSAFVILCSTIGCAASQTWGQLLACRILLGLGMGSKASVVPVFTAEIAPSHIRGSLVMTWQLFVAFGIFLGFSANLAVSQVGCSAWRWQIACSVIPAVVLLSLISVCVESPRFLVKHNKYAAAYENLVLLRRDPILAARDLFYMYAQIQETEGHRPQRQDPEEHAGPQDLRNNRRKNRTLAYLEKYLQNLGDLFAKPRIRRATVTAVVCMVGQQLCGVNVLAFYSSSFFDNVVKKKYTYASDLISNETCTPTPAYMQSLWFSWGIIGGMNFLAGFAAYWLIDKTGRRGLLLIALPFMSLTMLAAGLGCLSDTQGVRAGVVGTFIFLFMFCYSWSMGPVPFTISAEVFPLETRVPGMSFAVFTNFFGCGLLALFVPPLARVLTYGGLLGLFAGFNLGLFFLVFVFVRDTAGITIGSRTRPSRPDTPVDGIPQDPPQPQEDDGTGAYNVAKTLTLEELYYIFIPGTKLYCRYQWRVVIPWMWRHYVWKKAGEDGEEEGELESFAVWAQRQEDGSSENGDSDAARSSKSERREMAEVHGSINAAERTRTWAGAVDIEHVEDVEQGEIREENNGGDGEVAAAPPSAPTHTTSTADSSDGGVLLSRTS